MLSRVNASSAIAPIQSGSQARPRLEREHRGAERDDLEREAPAVGEREGRVSRQRRQERGGSGDARGEREPEAEQQEPEERQHGRDVAGEGEVEERALLGQRDRSPPLRAGTATRRS